MTMQQGGSEKITLEDVVFRYMMDISQTSGKIRTSTDLEYQKNADNFYYQVNALWSIVGDYIDPVTERKRMEILHKAKVKYEDLQKQQKDKPQLVKSRRDEIVALTVNSANQTLRLLSVCLSKKGILRERSSSAVAGAKKVEDNEEAAMDAELNLEGPEPEEVENV